MKETFLFSRQKALQKLAQSKKEFASLFRYGTLEIEAYQPIGTDKQQPHEKDELYVVISGNATFYHKGNNSEVTAGDCLFVPAQDEHRFYDFSKDFITWVFFFGPPGGEKKLIKT